MNEHRCSTDRRPRVCFWHLPIYLLFRSGILLPQNLGFKFGALVYLSAISDRLALNYCMALLVVLDIWWQ